MRVYNYSLKILLFLVAFQFCSPVFAGGYTDNHDDGNISGWTNYGTRTWSESGGYLVPENETNNYGAIINDYQCSNDGTFTVTVTGSDVSMLDKGGIVFRYTADGSNNNAYCITMATQVRMYKVVNNSMSQIKAFNTPISLSDNNLYSIKVILKGSLFKIYINDVYADSVIDASFPSGNVGYYYGTDYNTRLLFDRSSWEDDIIEYYWDVSDSSGYQAGNGTWGTDNYWSKNGGTALVSWVDSVAAVFAGARFSYSSITVNEIQKPSALTFKWPLYILTGGTLEISDDFVVTIGATGSAFIQSIISGTGNLKVTSSVADAVLNLQAKNTYSGSTTISGSGSNNPWLNIRYLDNGGVSSSIGSSSSDASNLIFDGGLLRTYDTTDATTDRLFTLTEKGGIIYCSGIKPMNFTNTGSIVFTGTGARTLELGGAKNVISSFSPVISDGSGGATSIKKTGPGTFALLGNNTFTGGLQINEGAIAFRNRMNLGDTNSTGASKLILDGGTLVHQGEIVSLKKLFSVGVNGGTLDGSGNGSLWFFNEGTIGLIDAASHTLTLSGTYDGNWLQPKIINYNNDTNYPTHIIKKGSGRWTLTSDNTATGTVTIEDGILELGVSLNTGMVEGPIVNNAILRINRGNDCYLDNGISGTGDLVKWGNGSLIFSGSNTYSGNTWINTGTLKLNASNVIPNGAAKGNVSVSGISDSGVFKPATFNLGGYSETINGLTGNGNVEGSSASLVFTIGDNNANSNFSGVIKGSLQLVKIGTGTITLSGANTFAGTTKISGGELKINGSTSGSNSFTVQSNAKLSGNGHINGTVSVENGGEISPGNDGVGKLTTGSLTLNNSSIIDFDIGPKSDTIEVVGNLVLDGSLNINNTSSFGSGTYTLFTYTGNLTNNTIEIGNTPKGAYSYEIEIKEDDKKVELKVVALGMLLPITVVEEAAQCSVYTDKWTLVFDNANGGGISALTDSCHGLNHGQGNQIDASQNLFFVNYDGVSSKANGTWSVQQKSTFWVIINQTGTFGNDIEYTNQYTIHGSGRMFVLSTVTNSGGSDVANKTVTLGVERSSVDVMSYGTDGSIPNSQYVLLSSSGTGQNDILLSVKDLWNNSVGIPNSVTSIINDNLLGTGYHCNAFSLGSNQKQSWEFMLDFSHQDWAVESDVLPYVNDYRQHDSLVFIKGTVAMERDWEQHIYGHWKFEEDTSMLFAIDESGNNNHGTKTSCNKVAGKYGEALAFGGSSKVQVGHRSIYNGSDGFTVMAWVKPSAETQTENASIMEKYNNDLNNGWRFGLSSGKPYFKINENTIYGTSSLSTGEWHHVAVRYGRGGHMNIYVNGNYDKIVPISNSAITNTNALLIGNLFNGAIDDARFYSGLVVENTIKSIYRNGFRSAEGVYDVRANNNNTLNLLIDGGAISRRFPVFRIANYWATGKPQNGCVRLDGKALVEGTDYYADLNDVTNVLYVGLNTVILSDSADLYIDDANLTDAIRRTTPKMVSGKEEVEGKKHYWVKNFTSNSFGSNTSKQWYLAWNMTPDNANDGKDGDVSFLASSVTNPNEIVDGSNYSNLKNHINSNSSSEKDSWGTYSLQINNDGSYPKTSQHVQDSFTYTVEESSSVRVKLRLNERNVFVSNERSFKIFTGWTIYPTGQIFKWDSLYDFGGDITKLYASTSMRQLNVSPTIYGDANNLRGVIMFGESGYYQDYVYAWLSMKNSNGYIQTPFDSDKINTSIGGSRVSFDFCDQSLSGSTIWNKNVAPIQTVVYLDIQKPFMDEDYLDSVANSAQTPLIPVVSDGELTTNSLGDFNNDGFNEREGAYVIKKTSSNVKLTISPQGGKCSYKPAFIITNYTATSKPQYVIIYDPSNQSGTETNLFEGRYYNAYVNRVKHELVLQIDSVFCSNVVIYISAGQTLAVQMSGFWGASGDNSDTLFWETESEQDNLGFLIYRRVSPLFYDSLSIKMNKEPDFDLPKELNIKDPDTLWEKITNKLIPGAQAGVSYGTKEYSYIDDGVVNGIVYEYKLESIDYDNSREAFGPIELKPIKRVPIVFKLRNNYPNPFKNRTLIKFDLPEEMRVTLNIYNLQGRLVRHLIRPSERLMAKTHQVFWDGKDDRGRVLASGPYIYRFSSEKHVKSRMMIKLD